MEYAADYEWTMSAEGEEDDAELAFADMRRVEFTFFRFLYQIAIPDRCTDQLHSLFCALCRI